MRDTRPFYGENNIFNDYSLTPLASVRNDRPLYILLSENGGTFAFTPQGFPNMTVVFETEEDAKVFDRRINDEHHAGIRYDIRPLSECTMPWTQALVLVKPVADDDVETIFMTCPKCGQQEYLHKSSGQGEHFKGMLPKYPELNLPLHIWCTTCNRKAPVFTYPNFHTMYHSSKELTDA